MSSAPDLDHRFVSAPPPRTDVPRTGVRRHRWKRRLALGLPLTFGLSLLCWYVVHLPAALPTVDRQSIWTDTVTRGPLVRDVQGLGTLTPEEIRWLPARTEGRVDRILVWPGAAVTADTVILQLSNEELVEQAAEADADLESAKAKAVSLEAQLRNEEQDGVALLAQAEAQRDTALAEWKADQRLARGGLIAALDLEKARIAAEGDAKLCEIQAKRLETTRGSQPSRLAEARAGVARAQTLAALRHGQLDALQVRAGMDGVLQAIAVDVGQRVAPGANLARVADAAKLKAQLKIPEVQARDVALGQVARIDLRNSVTITGKVSRVDSAVNAGTVTVDVTFPPGAPLPGGRPELTVEGSVERERLEDVLSVGRPAFAQDDSVVRLYRVVGDTASAVPVKLGRGSATRVVIEDGLQTGDRVILSDAAAFATHATVRLQ